MNTLSWKIATPAQILLWNYASGLIAYTTITPLYFQGAIAGSEFLTYAATKLYIGLQIDFDGSPGVGTTGPYVNFYDMANTQNFTASNNALNWNSTGAAANFSTNLLVIYNSFFSRILNQASITFIKFIGYRLNV